MSDGMIVGVIFLIIGVVLALIDLVFIILYKKKRKQCSEEVTATIVETLRYRKQGADGLVLLA